MIVVTINYRLGPLGWFTHPAIQNLQDGIDKTSNFGTLDIISALEWVNKNINLFGGDPQNITIFGESAGGHNVLSLIVSKQAKGLFHKAISMSGYTESISLEVLINKNNNLQPQIILPGMLLIILLRINLIRMIKINIVIKN